MHIVSEKYVTRFREIVLLPMCYYLINKIFPYGNKVWKCDVVAFRCVFSRIIDLNGQSDE